MSIYNLSLCQSKCRCQFRSFRQRQVLSSLKPTSQLMQLKTGVDRSRFPRLLPTGAGRRYQADSRTRRSTGTTGADLGRGTPQSAARCCLDPAARSGVQTRDKRWRRESTESCDVIESFAIRKLKWHVVDGGKRKLVKVVTARKDVRLRRLDVTWIGRVHVTS